MIRSTWTGIVPAVEHTYTMFDPAPAYDEGLPLADESYELARVNGFIGQGAPWAAYIVTGALFGPVRLTIEVHDGQPDVEGEWTEVVECEFVSHSGTLGLVEWGGEDIATLEGVLTPGPWGLRAYARGRDEASSREWSRDEEPVEEHLFQFWPGPHQGAVVLTTDTHGAGMRGEVVPEPLPRGRDRMPQEEFEEFVRSRDIILPLTEKMGLSGQRLMVELITEQIDAQVQRLIADHKPPH